MAHNQQPLPGGGDEGYPTRFFYPDVHAQNWQQPGSTVPLNGRMVFEMPGESAAPRKEESTKQLRQTHHPDKYTQANPWPFYLEESAKPTSKPEVKGEIMSTAEQADSNGIDCVPVVQSVQANPWAYFGPWSDDDKPSATIYSNSGRTHNGHIPCDSNDQVNGAPTTDLLSSGAQYGENEKNEEMALPTKGHQQEQRQGGRGESIYIPYSGHHQAEDTTPHSSFYPAPLKVSRLQPAPKPPPATYNPYNPQSDHMHNEEPGMALKTASPPSSDSPHSHGATQIPYHPYQPSASPSKVESSITHSVIVLESKEATSSQQTGISQSPTVPLSSPPLSRPASIKRKPTQPTSTGPLQTITPQLVQPLPTGPLQNITPPKSTNSMEPVFTTPSSPTPSAVYPSAPSPHIKPQHAITQPEVSAFAAPASMTQAPVASHSTIPVNPAAPQGTQLLAGAPTGPTLQYHNGAEPSQVNISETPAPNSLNVAPPSSGVSIPPPPATSKPTAPPGIPVFSPPGSYDPGHYPLSPAAVSHVSSGFTSPSSTNPSISSPGVEHLVYNQLLPSSSHGQGLPQSQTTSTLPSLTFSTTLQAPVARPVYGAPSQQGSPPPHSYQSSPSPPQPHPSYDASQPIYQPSANNHAQGIPPLQKPANSPPPPQSPRPQIHYQSLQVSPQSPPPPYIYSNTVVPGTQPPPSTPPGPYHIPPGHVIPPHQHHYPVQPIYAGPEGHYSAPPLPPRPPTVLGNQPVFSGFGSGPPNANMYPPPPRKNYVPPPHIPGPPQPPAGSSGTKLFSSASALKWLDKTGAMLENKIEAVLQGPQGPPHRPAYVPTQHPPPVQYYPPQPIPGSYPGGNPGQGNPRGPPGPLWRH